MATLYLNKYQPPSPLDPITENSELFEHTSPENYDLNSFLPIPYPALGTKRVTLQPLVPSIHADALSDAFSAPATDPDDVWFYPFPLGRPYKTKTETLMYLEKQRRRINVLSFAIIDTESGKMAGIISLGCDPLQASRDIRFLGVKLFPAFRRTHVFVHAAYALLGYVLNPVEHGGLGLPRCAWRTPPENTRSQRAAGKLGMTKEGTMRCYEICSASQVEGTAYTGFRALPDGTGRVVEDGIVFSMTAEEWLAEKRKTLGQQL